LQFRVSCLLQLEVVASCDVLLRVCEVDRILHEGHVHVLLVRHEVSLLEHDVRVLMPFYDLLLFVVEFLLAFCVLLLFEVGLPPLFSVFAHLLSFFFPLRPSFSLLLLLFFVVQEISLPVHVEFDLPHPFSFFLHLDEHLNFLFFSSQLVLSCMFFFF